MKSWGKTPVQPCQHKWKLLHWLKKLALLWLIKYLDHQNILDLISLLLIWEMKPRNKTTHARQDRRLNFLRKRAPKVCKAVNLGFFFLEEMTKLWFLRKIIIFISLSVSHFMNHQTCFFLDDLFKAALYLHNGPQKRDNFTYFWLRTPKLFRPQPPNHRCLWSHKTSYFFPHT